MEPSYSYIDFLVIKCPPIYYKNSWQCQIWIEWYLYVLWTSCELHLLWTSFKHHLLWTSSSLSFIWLELHLLYSLANLFSAIMVHISLDLFLKTVNNQSNLTSSIYWFSSKDWSSKSVNTWCLILTMTSIAILKVFVLCKHKNFVI